MDCNLARGWALDRPLARKAIRPKPRPSIVQVRGSGMPVVMDWLKPVMLPPPMRLRDAPSVIENEVLEEKRAVFDPENESGFVRGVPVTVSRRVPGVLAGLAPWILRGSAQNCNMLCAEPTASLKVREALSFMNETGGRKFVSLASNLMVRGAPVSLRIEDEESWRELWEPKVDWARVIWTNAPPTVWSMVRRLFAPPDTSQDSWPSKHVKVEVPSLIESCSLAIAGLAAAIARIVVVSRSFFISKSLWAVLEVCRSLDLQTSCLNCDIFWWVMSRGPYINFW
jgi:hypothetical protein